MICYCLYGVLTPYRTVDETVDNTVDKTTLFAVICFCRLLCVPRPLFLARSEGWEFTSLCTHLHVNRFTSELTVNMPPGSSYSAFTPLERKPPPQLRPLGTSPAAPAARPWPSTGRSRFGSRVRVLCQRRGWPKMGT